MNFGMIFTAKNVLNRRFELAEVADSLRRIDRREALTWCAEQSRRNQLHMALHSSWQETKDAFGQLIQEIIPAGYHKRAWQIHGEAGFISPFSEVGMVGLIGLVCRYCATSGGVPVDSLAARWRLFTALLAVQGSIVPEELIKPMAGANAQALKALLKAHFPYVTRNTLATICQQNQWGYDVGRLHALTSAPEVGAYLAANSSGMSVADWFSKRLGINATDYELIANIQFGAAALSVDFEALNAQCPCLAPSVKKLLSLSTITPEELVRSQPPPTSLLEASNHSEALIIRPLVKDGNRHHVTSLANLFNKFHRGLPYLALQARQVTDGHATDGRAEFGYIFQGYITWLVSQWFAGSPVQVIPEYWTAGCGLLPGNGEPYEKDLLLIADDVAYAFEIKASVPRLDVRRRGGITDFRDMLKPVTLQAYQAAQAIMEGKAFYDRSLMNPIPAVKRVYPCGVGYEFNPLRFPYSDFFQEALEFDLGCSAFRDFPRIAPMQYFDVQQIEIWDDLFELPADWAGLFAAIRCRSEEVLERYQPVLPQTEFRADSNTRPGIVSSLADRAEQEASERLKVLNANPPP